MGNCLRSSSSSASASTVTGGGAAAGVSSSRSPLPHPLPQFPPQLPSTVTGRSQERTARWREREETRRRRTNNCIALWDMIISLGETLQVNQTKAKQQNIPLTQAQKLHLVIIIKIRFLNLTNFNLAVTGEHAGGSSKSPPAGLPRGLAEQQPRPVQQPAVSSPAVPGLSGDPLCHQESR